MSGKSEKFFDAITHLREDLIEEAQNYKFRKRASGWKTFGSLAACIMLIMSIGVLAILPRGCGSAGGGADSSSSASAPADNAAPQDAPSTDTAPPPYGDVSGSASGEPGAAPGEEAPESNAPPAGAEHYRFTAIVIEVQDEAVLAEPVEYNSHQQVLIPFTNQEFPVLSEGDWITVTVEGGLVLTTDPPMVLGVQSIEKIDPAE